MPIGTKSRIGQNGDVAGSKPENFFVKQKTVQHPNPGNNDTSAALCWLLRPILRFRLGSEHLFSGNESTPSQGFHPAVIYILPASRFPKRIHLLSPSHCISAKKFSRRLLLVSSFRKSSEVGGRRSFDSSRTTNDQKDIIEHNGVPPKHKETIDVSGYGGL